MTLREIFFVFLIFTVMQLAHSLEVTIMDYEDIDYNSITVYDLNRESEENEQICCPCW